MEGGILAWEGLVAEGAPEAARAFFASARSPEEYTALAWLLEKGTQAFYEGVKGMLDDKEAVDLFQELIVAEEHHKSMLETLYKELSGESTETALTLFRSMETESQGVIEGGMKLKEALTWAQGKTLRDILELSLSLEANAYDRYLSMGRDMGDNPSVRVFKVISEEEKHHLERMAELFNRVA